MLNHRRNNEAAIRAKERRDREDAAPRLTTRVPRLLSLALEIKESRGEQSIFEASHVRRIVVERAPALFELACAERGCEGGGHNLTLEIMRSLSAGRTQFDGHDTCGGQVGNNPCGRELRFQGTATYSE